jgi:hypothetical protein
MADRIIDTELADGDTQAIIYDSDLCDKGSEKTAEAAITRREIIKFAAGAMVAVPLVGMTKAEAVDNSGTENTSLAADTKAHRFFTPQEFALVDELTELIIPTDDHSPGARAALVAAYIDARLAESFTDEPKLTWRNGLKLIETLSRGMHGCAFLKSTPEQRIALLTRISQNEVSPKSAEEVFFGELKRRTVRGYYTSKIGIHTEMEYKGNTYQKEYAGFDAT